MTFLPYAALLIGVAWAMFAEKLPGGDKGAALIGGVLTLAAGALFLWSSAGQKVFGMKIWFTYDSRLASMGICLLTALWLFWIASRATGRVREATALGMLSAMGGCLMVGAYDLIVMVLAIELATMPAYVLIGYRKYRLKGLEGAVKYFLLSVLSSLVMIYGATFLYGIMGTSSFSGFNLAKAGTIGLVAVLLLFVGIFAKLSAAPFHYWAPDAYEGAESWIVAFVASVPKIAGIVLAVRLVAVIDTFSSGSAAVSSLGTVLAIAAVASMVLGSFAALTQKDTRRVMAYSGVVNAGYMLIPLVTMSESSVTSVVLYALFYATATMGILLVTASEGGKISDLAGLSRRRPAAAWGLAIFALSLIGVPPMAGFFGKFYMFTATVHGGHVWLVVVATIASVVSAFYYLRFVKTAFFDEETAGEDATNDIAVTVEGGSVLDVVEKTATAGQADTSTIFASVAIVVCVVLTVAFGPLSGLLMSVLTSPWW